MIFGLFDLLELDFCPHLAGLPDRRLYHLPGMRHDTAAGRLLDHPINTQLIAEHWDELLRIAASIKHGHVTASLLVQRLQAHPNRSQLARALQEYGRIIKTRRGRGRRGLPLMGNTPPHKISCLPVHRTDFTAPRTAEGPQN